jgi:hypothetical protein
VPMVRRLEPAGACDRNRSEHECAQASTRWTWCSVARKSNSIFARLRLRDGRLQQPPSSTYGPMSFRCPRRLQDLRYIGLFSVSRRPSRSCCRYRLAQLPLTEAL